MPSPSHSIEARRRLITLAVIAALAVPALVYIVGDEPGGNGERAETAMALTASGPVEPTLREVQLTKGSSRGPKANGSAKGRRTAPAAVPTQGRIRKSPAGATALLSDPEPVEGYGTVGVTWRPTTRSRASDIAVWARTRTASDWTRWVNFDYDAEHEPDPSSQEAGDARAGTDPFPVGVVDDVQVRLTVPGGQSLPTDLRLAIVDPREDSSPRLQRAALIDGTSTTDDAVALTSADGSVPEQPAIFSRAQWGADERLRDPGSLHYGTVSVGFVHHTVNANNYTRAQVPALLRGIYAYHTQAKGWSDIGYNFVVDRFGRIWEGRYGGVDRAVVGAHTLGYNDEAFAMSALGNFETARPTAATLDAYARLFAWKLSLHGVSVQAKQPIGGTITQAVSGHRDADSTACPGRYLYAKLPEIRAAAAARQTPFTARQRRADLGGTPAPDFIFRDRVSGRATVARSGQAADGSLTLTAVPSSVDLTGVNLLLNVGDWNRDGYGDFMARATADRSLVLYTGGKDLRRSATFTGPVATGLRAIGLSKITPAGDLSGDGVPDLVAVERDGGLAVYPGDGASGFKRPYGLSSDNVGVTGVGLWNGDGAPDFVQRAGDGTLTLRVSNGPGALVAPPRPLGTVKGYSALRGVGDLTGDGRVDVVAKRGRELWVLPGRGKRVLAPQLLASDIAKYDLMG
ncbi:N-acetylmuramoyl-L-alanine amidase [Nocardioides sp. SOB77]|uniref:N-acetylmuramoyl-L-alanine amidase n=1 Tax=Nocardioides oceani TaxID=3058369 RepID=A0ABT8FMA2_9ACTN|nr:N-acetylmuramoyl-L-alanine amidase [Nocardioides oceani]MDN4175792.1 N-acetylmuramoyl-L-alanine amidase [Nocardioides oceani]